MMLKKTAPSLLLINRIYPPGRGATGRVLRDLAQEFAARGWDVTVLATGPRSAQEYDGAVRVIRVKQNAKSKNFFSYSAVWLKLLLKGMVLPSFDLVVTMTDPPLLVVAGNMIARLKGARHMHWMQDVYPDLLPVLGMKIGEGRMDFMKNLARRALKRCDKIVVIGRCMARHLTHGGIEPGRIALIPNWPDQELCPVEGAASGMNTGDVPPVSSSKNPENARPFSELLRDGQDQKFRVLYAGNLGRAHPLKAVLQAADLLKTDHPEIEFLFVGSGQNFERLARERARLDLRNIRFLPFQPAARLREVMESGDVHLVTMREEAAGLLVPSKLYSALAAARPCLFVGPERSEAARVIKEFGAGSVIASGDGQALARAILDYRNDAQHWFAAHEGASAAGRIFMPEAAMEAFIARALEIVQRKTGGAKRS